MLASASGPLGALLVIAPLAAIPVVAIVGIPQFAPVSASPNEEEEIGDLGESAATQATPRPAIRRSADDLFAPLPGSGPANSNGTQYGSVYGNTSRSAPPAGQGRESRFDHSLDAGDNWEVVSSDPRNSTGRTAGTGTSLSESFPSDGRAPQGRGSSLNGTGAVDPNGFKSGLLPSVHPKEGARRDEVKRPGAVDRGAVTPDSPRVDPRTMNELVGGASLEAMQQMMMSEQSRWQAAATRIKQLRIQKYRLEARIEEPRFVFRCVFAPAESSQVTQLFEADAETPIDAVEQVIEQVDEWLKSHDENAAVLLD